MQDFISAAGTTISAAEMNVSAAEMEFEWNGIRK